MGYSIQYSSNNLSGNIAKLWFYSDIVGIRALFKKIPFRFLKHFILYLYFNPKLLNHHLLLAHQFGDFQSNKTSTSRDTQKKSLNICNVASLFSHTSSKWNSVFLICESGGWHFQWTALLKIIELMKALSASLP